MNSNSSIRTSFGLKNGRIVGLVEVESGLNCNCVCPECGAALVAKKGDKNAWHFAHHREVASQSCVETAIHAAAKQLLLDAMWLRVPSKEISVRGRTITGEVHAKHDILSQEKVIRFDRCQAEVWETNLRPDVVGYRGGRRMLVEMYFTHKVDDEKLRKLREQGLPAVEINLSDLSIAVDFETLRHRVLESIEYKEWLFIPGEVEAKFRLEQELNQEIVLLNAKEAFVQNRRKQKEERAQQQKLKAEAAITAANERYRQLPRREKELQLQTILGVKGKWPYFLEKFSKEATSICEPPRIWQSALFSRFIFGKAHSLERIEIDTLFDWVSGRFGIVDGESDTAKIALRMYLGYLAKCGFLQKPDSLYGKMYYTVCYDSLVPPPKVEKAFATRSDLSVRPLESRSMNRETQVQWMWKSSWPVKDAMLAQARLSVMGKEPMLMMALQAINHHNKPNNPEDFAEEMQAYGIATEVTLQLLVDIELALKHTRIV